MIPTLNFTRTWQAIGWLLVALVCWLSLTPAPPEPPVFLTWDKAQHFLAYGVLMFWYGQAFARHWRWPVCLISLGVGLEFLQGWSGLRHYDPYDMLANSLGVVLGLAFSFVPPLARLAWFDAWLARRWVRVPA
ncbi:VanZ family protein [Methylococcus sp. EFPC2]|uniref:VanZ family protein n=1 Tax=Methylococcus sp. EFPC2 TaxID=2812648 RepID=UPI00196713B7|nr:VanZ family protein [Methylococcus sp. EFPC2]QSA98227.1 VanZ family protein [Methylococcus sp. EFPC2]